MKKVMGFIISVVLIAGMLTGCFGSQAGNNVQPSVPESDQTETNTNTPEPDNSTEQPAWPRTVEDDFNHSITLEKKPERVVVLYFGNIENLVVLGHPPVGAAWADRAMNGFGTLKPYAEEIEIIDLGSPREPSMERILELSPDLIVGTAAHAEVYDDLNKIAPTLLFNSPEWKENLNNYANFIGAEEVAEQFIGEVDSLMTEARDTLSAYSDKTFFFAWDQGKNTFYAFGTTATSQQAFFDKEIGLGLTAPSGYPQEGGKLSLESLAGLDPDYIFIVGELGSAETGYQVSYSKADTEASSVWKSLTAMQSDNVYFLDPACVTGSPLGVKMAIETIVDSLDVVSNTQ